MENLWTELEAGPDVPGVINVIVEITKGSRNKYEYDKHNGVIRLNRVWNSITKTRSDFRVIRRCR
jgi:inorganic pyrophosphatase